MTAIPTQPRTPNREPLGVLLSVCLDRAASNPWVELYRARSDRFLDVTYDVRFEQRAATPWSCNCPATRPCKHIARCARLRRVNWWAAMLAGQTPAVLRAELARREDRIATTWADEDDHAAADYCRLALGEAVAA